MWRALAALLVWSNLLSPAQAQQDAGTGPEKDAGAPARPPRGEPGGAMPDKYINTNIEIGSVSVAAAQAACPQAGHERLICFAAGLKILLPAETWALLQLPYSVSDAKKWSNFPPMGYRDRVGLTLGDFDAEQLGIVKAMLIEASGMAANEGYDELEQILNADDYLIAETGEHFRGRTKQPQRRGHPHEAQHGCRKYRRVGRYPLLDKRAQHEVPAHRMADKHVRTGRFLDPLAPQYGEVGGPRAEIVDVAGQTILAQPPRSALPAPVAGGNVPALARPLVQRFEVFLVVITASGHEQDRSPRILRRDRPVDPPDPCAIGGFPVALTRGVGDGAAIEGCARFWRHWSE